MRKRRIPLSAIIILLICAGFPLFACAATLRSVKAGSWSDAATWLENKVPAKTDSVTVSHEVTLSGQGSASGVTALSIANGGLLNLAAGSMLEINGNLVIGQGKLQIMTGAALTFQNAGQLQLSGTGSELSVVGEKSSRGRISSAGGPLTLAAQSGSRLSLHFSVLEAVALNVSEGVVADLKFVQINNSPATRVTLDESSSFSLVSSSWKGTSGAASIIFSIPLTPPALGYIQGNVFDQTVRFSGTGGLYIARNLFLNNFAIDADSGQGWALFDGNLVRNTTPYEVNLTANISNNIWLTDGNLINPHFVQTLTWRPTDIDGDIFLFTGSDDNGDAIVVGASDDLTLNIRHVLVLPNGAGKNSGTLFSALGAAGQSIYAENNTYFAGMQGAAVGETYAGHRDMLKSFRNNIAWNNSPDGYKLFDSGPDQNVPDLVRADAADFNCGFNLLSGTNGKGYSGLQFSAGHPGAHDIDQDPVFFSPGRNIATWDGSLGGPGTTSAALSRLSRVNDDDANPLENIASVINHIRVGYSPSNPGLKDGGYKGSEIGAVPAGYNDSTPLPTSTPLPLPTGVPTWTPAPLITPVPSLPTPRALSLNVKVQKRKALIRWKKIGCNRYHLILRKQKKLVSNRRITRTSATFSSLRRGKYTVECRLKCSAQALSREKVAFSVR